MLSAAKMQWGFAVRSCGSVCDKPPLHTVFNTVLCERDVTELYLLRRRSERVQEEEEEAAEEDEVGKVEEGR